MHMSDEAIQKVRGVVIVVLPLVGFLVAVYLLWNRYVFARDMVLLGAMYAVTLLGIGIGYHRMLTHQGFQASAWLRGFFIACGSMAWEGAPIMWAATHIKHHAHSDEEGDPHSPLEGFWHAHCGWIFAAKNFPEPKTYAPHLLEDSTVVFVDRFAAVWMALALVIPFAFGGWTGLLWGGVVRIFLTTHVTWSVNSICHMFGHRAFETTDESRNEWVVGLLAFGEGWHNNHHAFPENAFHGLRWWQFDLSGLLIAGLEKIGLVWNVQRVSEEAMEAQRSYAVRASVSIQEMRRQLLDRIQNADAEVQSVVSSAIATLDPAEIARLETLQRDAVIRLVKMRQFLARATHIKRPKLLAYRSEIDQLLTQVKQALPQAMTVS
ncbi:fatty acid desaturase [Candidatus Peregrinibacteria bacterium]|nr:fatty acid desaturase [Candidatus Peregrinibacteria bacterium]